MKHSNLTEEEKNKALKSHNKMVKTTILITVLVVIVMAILMFIGLSIGGEIGVIISVASMALAVIVIVLFTTLRKKLFPDWVKYYDIVDRGFDGLSEQEISQLKPNDREKKIIKKYKKKLFVNSVMLIIAFVIEFTIILNLKISIYSPITLIITIIIAIVWYVIDNSYRVKVHRIESGSYKSGFEYVCQNCNGKVKIEFENIDKYNSLPKDENGIRVIQCPYCNNLISLYGFDDNYNDYKKYLEQIK